MIIYISIPITGHDEELQRLKAYNMELKLKERGHIVINPFQLADAARRFKKRELTWEEYMKIDLFILQWISDGVVFMKGWPDSKGCMEEMDCAIKHEKLLFTEESVWQAG